MKKLNHEDSLLAIAAMMRAAARRPTAAAVVEELREDQRLALEKADAKRKRKADKRRADGAVVVDVDSDRLLS